MAESDIARSVSPVNIEDEMRQSYMDYAMSVIVGRALPDVRDGLKPVHRRVLYAMHEAGNDWNKPYRKSARVVGDVIGKYHPHGDSAVYDTIVRMAQPFSLRYVLVDGQGNFGSVDGDAPAAMRYTEVRMARIAHEMLADIDKETVDFVPNYDGSESEPSVLPARIPNLLVNGSSGIAVGMATNIPPHNLNEVLRACIQLIDDPATPIEMLMKLVPGPDFPTAGIINGTSGIHEAYLTGRGRVVMRARTTIEEDADSGAARIVVSELPYQVNKARLLEKIAELVKDKKLSGIRELRDESDKEGMRMVVELKRGENADVILNNLYKHTAMQSVFGMNMVALEDGQPRLLNLKQLLEAFIRHRREVVTRRTVYELRKARQRAHVLEGLAVALANIDEVIERIKNSPTPAEAKTALLEPIWNSGMVSEMLGRAGAAASKPDDLPPEIGLQDNGYQLSDAQAQAILDLKLQRLTGLEQDKILKEYGELLDTIAELLDILARPARLMEVIRNELSELSERFGDARRTEIQEDASDLSIEDLITDEDVVVTLSHAGYAKRQPISDYRSQRRGGRGKSATTMKDEDFIDKVFIASTHDTVLCFSSRGKLYWLKVYELPQATRTARGKPIVNLLPLDEGERINTLLPVREYSDDKFVFMATADGTVKKTPLTAFSRPRPSGIIAIDLAEDNWLIGVELTDGKQDVMLFSNAGKAVRFNEQTVRAMGRTARGVRGIGLAADQRVISLLVPSPGCSVLTATMHGYGKRTDTDDYPAKGRGTQGVISIKTSERNGEVVGAICVAEDDEVMLISDRGTLIRTPVRDVSVLSRNTQGVRLVSLSEGERLAGLQRITPEEEAIEAVPAADNTTEQAESDEDSERE
ncbi:DNA gyrase subunit A [Methylohalomonas lacus]|uniref:DNA gyrase subunit A n=1 Tax=Methylohalomonas lacus TaxID=398773 RepID=A0AAE3HKV3_9GAMM|nr:DNA gyrase subunit A [Methylohalomonas lacus]MCS3902282.1 DNA gyrase subunit A [Methylohalomonas lacus]